MRRHYIDGNKLLERLTGGNFISYRTQWILLCIPFVNFLLLGIYIYHCNLGKVPVGKCGKIFLLVIPTIALLSVTWGALARVLPEGHFLLWLWPGFVLPGLAGLELILYQKKALWYYIWS